MKGFKPLTFVLDPSLDEAATPQPKGDLLYILALDGENRLWIFFALKNATEPEFGLMYSKSANAPHAFTQKTHFAHRSFIESSPLGYEARCFDIYFCSSVLAGDSRTL